MKTLKQIFNKKGVVTTIAGIIALIGLGFKVWTEKGMSVEDFVILITALGLIAAKDQNKSHTQE